MILDFLIYIFALIGLLVLLVFAYLTIEEIGGEIWVWVKNFFQTPYYCILVIFSSKIAKRFDNAFKKWNVQKSQWGLRIILWFANKKLKA